MISSRCHRSLGGSVKGRAYPEILPAGGSGARRLGRGADGGIFVIIVKYEGGFVRKLQLPARDREGSNG